jgi:hypothetical protein
MNSRQTIVAHCTVSVHDDKLCRGLALTSRTLRYVDRASASRSAGLESRTGQICDRPELKLEAGGVVIMWLRVKDDVGAPGGQVVASSAGVEVLRPDLRNSPSSQCSALATLC